MSNNLETEDKIKFLTFWGESIEGDLDENIHKFMKRQEGLAKSLENWFKENNYVKVSPDEVKLHE